MAIIHYAGNRNGTLKLWELYILRCVNVGATCESLHHYGGKLQLFFDQMTILQRWW